MNLKPALRTVERFIVNNSPAIMTGIGAAGVIATAVMTGKASYSAAIKISNEELSRADRVPNKERAELVWKEFIPPAVVGTITLLAIIGANRVSSKRAAALAAAFKISEQMAGEYQERVVQTLGKKAEEELRADLAKERMDRTPGRDVIILGENKTMFFDEVSGRYFQSTRQQIDNAVNQINHQINQTFYASLSEFYDLLELPKSEFSDELGWNSDELLDVFFTAVLMDDGQPAVAIRYNTTPFRHYNKVR